MDVNTGRRHAGANDGVARKTRPRTEPAVWVSTPAFDGAHWDEQGASGSKHPTIKQIFREINDDSRARRAC